MGNPKLNLRTVGTIRWARFALLLALGLGVGQSARSQQVITTAVSSGPNVIAMATYQGNIYYATATPGAIYKLTPSGNVTLIAGTPNGGSTGDTINTSPPATSVSIAPGINGLAFDASGNLFFTEPTNHQIREIVAPVDVPGTVMTTFDNAGLSYPGALAIRGGVMYWADESQHVVSSMNMTTGAARIVAGTLSEFVAYPSGGYSGDGGPANQATLNHPRGLAFDLSGNLLIADTGNNVIRRVDSAGHIGTIAGTGAAGFVGDGGSATSAKLFLPDGIAVDPAGNILIADTSNNRIRFVTPAGTISTIAGNGTAGFAGDGSAAANASLAFPATLALDTAGNLYIADSQNNRVRVIAAGNISTLAGGTQPNYSGDGAAEGNSLNQPSYIAFDSAGNMFFSDTYNSRVRRVDAASHAIATVAGNAVPGNSGVGGPATSAQIGCPNGISFGKNHSLLIADPCSQQVFQVAPSSDGLITGRADEVFSVFAPGLLSGPPDAISVESTGTVVVGTVGEFGGGQVNAIDSLGNLSLRSNILPFSLATGPADRTLVGSSSSDNDPISDVSVNGGNLFASWSDFGICCGNEELIGGLAFDSFGNVYASTSQALHTVFELTSTSVSPFAGNRTQGYSGDGGQPASARLNQPLGLAVDPSGNVFIADAGNNVIREVGAAVAPPPPGVPTLTSTPSNPANQNSASFTFSDLDPTVTAFFCTLDSSTSSCTSAVSYSNLADGSHTFSVLGKRADGTSSASATFTWTVDTTPPPIPSIDSHPANPSASGNATFAFSDSESAVAFRCSLDSAATSCASPAVYLNLADGTHTFSVSAADSVGNRSASATFAWTISTTPPPPPHIDSAPAALSNQKAPAFSFSDAQAGVTFLCQMDTAQAAPCTVPAIYVGLPDGLHTFSVAANDPASGRSSAPATYTWTQDTTPPRVGIQGSPATVVIPNASTVYFSGSSADIVGYQCSTDGSPYVPCSSPFTQSINTPGGHDFSVEAVDAAGNVSDPDSTSWNVTYCHCNLVGPYSNPAFNDRVSATSQNFNVRVTYAANGLDLADISVVQAGNGAVVYTLPSTARGWQFSPDQTHFVFLDSLPYPNSPVEATVLDLSTTPAKRVLTVSNVGGALEFSPSGVFLMVVGAPLGTGNSSQYSVSVYRVGDVSQGVLAYSTTSSGATAAWGFSDSGFQEAETSFLFAFASGQNTVTWNVGYLPTGKQTISQTSTLGNAFWQFNPCGNIIALVSNKPGSSEQVDLFSTETGMHLGGTSFPVQNVTLRSTVDPNGNPEEIGTISNPQQDLLIYLNKCSANTPTGNNVSVSPTCSQNNSDQVSVTFSDVTQEGGTGVNESSTGNAPPGDFQVGNPPVYYDIATSATYSGEITICINYAGITFSGTPRLFHFENGAWVDRTTSVDTTTHTVCATVTSLSPFALFSEPVGQAPTITSADNATFQLGSAGGFAVLATGSPAPAISESGTLPAGVRFVDNGDGSAVLTGTPTSAGTFSITFTANNGVGSPAVQQFSLVIPGASNQPPTANAGTNQTVEATGPAGAAITLAGSGSDPDNDPLTFTWSEAGTTFGNTAQLTVTLSIGVHTLTLTANDGRGGTGTSNVTITVHDTTPPAFTPPANQVLEATGPAGAIASFGATATDIVDGTDSVLCAPASGSTFALGTTTVVCTATDRHGNASTASFTVTVRDTRPPLVTAPANITIPATEAGGARVSAWPSLVAFLAGATSSDLVDPRPVQLAPQVGTVSVNGATLFPLGTTTVLFQFRDASGNIGSASATVTVNLGSIHLSSKVVDQGKNADGTLFVDLAVSNTGNGNARNLRVDLVVAIPTKGSGVIRVMSPAFPMTLGIGNLDSGSSQTIRVILKVPTSVKQFALAEGGTFTNVKGSADIFAFEQTLAP